jgi:indolepyruvate ferredoxin oxidoreductase alpha subunit
MVRPEAKHKNLRSARRPGTGVYEMKLLLNGDEAVAAAALDCGVNLGTGYPGTPSTEILEEFDKLGGRAQWAPNEKVAMEVAIGACFAGARALVTMKHVGLNVAADPLFTVAYEKVNGALVVVSADDPGMASSQDEQDNRRYAVFAGVPMLEPADSQEAYDYMKLALEISHKWNKPVMLRMTTRVCHSKTAVERMEKPLPPAAISYAKDAPGHIMMPAFARAAHRQLRAKLHEMQKWNDESGPNKIIEGSKSLGIITSGISFQHVRDAAPEASVLKLGMTYPLPIETIRKFAAGVDRCLVVEEGDPYLVEQIRYAGINVEEKLEEFRFGELNIDRVRKLIAKDTTPEPKAVPGKPPALCPGCPHRSSFENFRDANYIVAGDIGCYGLGALAPFEANDTSVCMGASIPVGLGLRHVLPAEQAKKVVSVLGDSTFMHTGINGLIEMIYNPPPTGHVLVILDNGITAMTGMQENPGTGRRLDHTGTNKVDFVALIRALGVKNVHVIDPVVKKAEYAKLLEESLEKPEITVIIARRECLLAAKSIREWEKMNAEQCSVCN